MNNSPKLYIVEGYNRNDYITDIVNWETLFVSADKKAIDDYIINIPEDYVIRVHESGEITSYDVDNHHWEIYTGV